ncbi:MAG TPA: hypothetical protein VMD91_05530 [Candidatus Sulfotelmatobacter sp.]|nr:hypothetical protein [Candidatus Sulfotelmatobacter sp.]
MAIGFVGITDALGVRVPREVSDDLWRLAYMRGHVDIDHARPLIDRLYAGILVYAHTIDPVRTLVVVDGGDRLVAAVGRFPAVPPVASAVRLVGAYDGDATWKLLVDEPFRLAAEVRFERQAILPDDRRWVETLRNAIALIRTSEVARRDRLAVERRCLPALSADTALDVLLRERTEAIRRDAERQSDYTALERLQMDAARASRASSNPTERRRGELRESELVRARQARFDTAVNGQLAALREAAPNLREQAQRIAARNRQTRETLGRIESAYADSLARSAAAYAAIGQLDALEGAPFVVEGLHVPLTTFEDPARAHDLLRGIALLVRALPRTRTLIAV